MVTDTEFLDWLESQIRASRSTDAQATEVRFVVPPFMTVREYLRGCVLAAATEQERGAPVRLVAPTGLPTRAIAHALMENLYDVDADEWDAAQAANLIERLYDALESRGLRASGEVPAQPDPRSE
jgi:hypothetical protein